MFAASGDKAVFVAGLEGELAVGDGDDGCGGCGEGGEEGEDGGGAHFGGWVGKRR